MNAYYNETDPYAAQWLRNLIAAGEIAPGDVDTRSIVDVQPSDLDGYSQCHFFAGIGIWSRALRSAGWNDTRPIWTGSCPCQPFSTAGAGVGFNDERHLWPHWHWLIEQCRPETILGEQVASNDGLGWADLVSHDLEATDYAVGFVDTCAAGFKSFHIRQRLYFAAHDCRPPTTAPEHPPQPTGGMGNTSNTGLERQRRNVDSHSKSRRNDADQDGPTATPGTSQRLANTYGRDASAKRQQSCRELGLQPKGGGRADRLANTHGKSERGRPKEERGATPKTQDQIRLQDGQRHGPFDFRSSPELHTRPPNGYWRNADWLLCRDGNWRPVEPGTFPLAHENTARMGRLRAYGNALDLAQATGFVRAYMERDLADLDTTPAGDLFEWGAK